MNLLAARVLSHSRVDKVGSLSFHYLLRVLRLPTNKNASKNCLHALMKLNIYETTKETLAKALRVAKL